MVFQIIPENETKNFWTFKEIGINAKPYDVPKNQLADALITLELWQKKPDSDNFTSKLYNLMSKADKENFRKLFNAFPARVSAYCLWYHSKDKSELQKYLETDKK